MARVAFITNCFLDDRGQVFGGGAELHLYQLARLARDLGADPTVYQPGREAMQRRVDGIDVQNIDATPKGIWNLGTRQALLDGHTFLHYQYPWSGAARAVKPGTWVTATQQGVYWDIPFVAAANRWYPGGRLARWLLPVWRYQQREGAFRAVAGCREVLAEDTSLLRVIQSDRPELRARIHVASNFCDIVSENPSAYTDGVHSGIDMIRRAKSTGSIVVLVPRNVSFTKGAWWLPAIVQEVTKQLEAKCHFFVTGVAIDTAATAKRCERELPNLVNSLDIEAKGALSFLNGVPHSQMVHAYLASDIVLIPTFAYEATSISAIEAMMLGRAVVATNVGGLNDLIDDEWTGLLTQTTVKAIAAGIVRLARDVPLRERLSSAARTKAEACLTLESWRERVRPFIQRNGWCS